ncbi:YciI family protein [Gilvimarinus algae]|uniref:YCII-related domain-containing protein n=1 Tax=Gilvimarinus algae TaxID=3058037 RepID=A0ABT8T917_9GAMM|nr:YciI family protein [Gilvimarinus sp. SDUM040014]MDO3380624.1 hypothetical protein [Gilvimarinus sp. SDUM040014]
MFVILLRFSENRDRAGDYMAAHNEWIKEGFADEVFLLAGSLRPGIGGAIVAHNTSLEALQARTAQDPFVVHTVVTAEILDIAPGRVDERLSFLMAQGAPA